MDLTLSSCNLNPSSVPGLVHLVDAGTLTSLFIYNEYIALFREAEARAFAKAVLDNRTLTKLSLHGVRLWVRGMVVSVLSRLSFTWLRTLAPQDILATGEVVVEALVGHPTLEVVSLGPNAVADADRQVVGEMLGRLVSVNAPSLTSLSVRRCDLCDEGLRGIFAVLATNNHLRTLICPHNTISREFTAEVLQAVRTKTLSLQVQFGSDDDSESDDEDEPDDGDESDDDDSEGEEGI